MVHKLKSPNVELQMHFNLKDVIKAIAISVL